MAELRVDAPLKPKDKRPVGRPAIYTPELAAEFCRRISEGRSEKSVCSDADMPSHTTIQKWEREDPEFAASYAHARDARASHLAEEALRIADELGDSPSSEQVQAARLRVDTRKWFAAKLAPKKYGDRIQTDATVNANVTGDMTMRLQAMSDDELARILTDAASIASAGGGMGTSSQTGS